MTKHRVRPATPARLTLDFFFFLSFFLAFFFPFFPFFVLVDLALGVPFFGVSFLSASLSARRRRGGVWIDSDR